MSIEQYKKLSTACWNGDIDKVILLLQNGAPVNLIDCYDFDQSVDIDEAPIMCACLKGHVEICKKLIEYGADKEYDNNGTSCLSLACWYGYLDLVKLFIKAGYDVNRENWYGCGSPLESTLHSKNLCILRELLSNGLIIPNNLNENEMQFIRSITF